jgi:S1-C subfamily serine protease
MFDAANKVVGINTAAARGFGRNASVGLAVPIDTAKDVVAKIRDGNETSTIHIGVRGFLGVRTSDVAAGGAGVVSVQPGSPAEKAGVATGDVITTVDGTVIRTASALTNLIHTHRPGDTVTLAWTRSDGTTHSAKVTLASGAAD